MGYLNNSGLSHFWDKLKQFFVKKSEVENAGISSITYTTVLASTTVTTVLATGYRYPSAVLSSSVPTGFSQAHLYRITIGNAEKRMPCVLWYRKNNAGTGIQPIEFVGNPSYMLAEDVTSYFGHGDVDTTCGFCISSRDIANDGARKLMLFTPTAGSYTVKIELENRDVTKLPPDLTFDYYNNPISEVAIPNKSNSISVGPNYMKHKTGTTSVGSGNTNSGANSTSVGVFNEASGQLSVAVGTQNKASGLYSLAVGNSNQSTGSASSAFGYFTESSGAFATTNGQRTIANHKSQFVFGEFNEPDPSEAAATARGTYVEIVGNGTSSASADRSNARTLDWDGNERLAGSLTLGAGTEDEKTITPEQLANTVYNTDEDVFQIRHAKAEKPSYNSEVIRKITGGTLAWNQLAIAPFGQTTMGVTFSRSTDRTTVTMNGTVTGGTIYKQFSESPKTIIDHIYFVDKGSDLTTFMIYNDNAGVKTELANRRCIGKATAEKKFYIWCGNGTTYNNVSFKPMIVDLTAAFGTSIANYIFSLGSEAGYRYLIDSGLPFGLYHSPTHDGSWNPISTLANTYFDEYDTTGMNLWDEEVVMGYFDPMGTWVTDTEHVSSKNPITVMPNTTYYCKCSGPAYITFWKNPVMSGSSRTEEFISRTSASVSGATFTTPSDCRAIHFNLGAAYGVTYKHDVCINLSDESRNGQYEPYRHSRITFFGNPVILRGFPYLDENDNLRFDGDTLEAPGKINRRYGIVDLGTRTWSSITTSNRPYFLAPIDGMKPGTVKVVCPWSYKRTQYAIQAGEFTTTQMTSVIGLYVYNDSSYSDATSFKAAMSGVYLVYELATPTEEEFTPIDGPLVSDPLGLEIISKSDWDDTPTLAQMDILYANEARANVEMIATNKIIASQNSAKDLSKCITVKPGTLLPSGTDLNTVKVFGEYFLRGSYTMYSYTNAAFSGNSKLLVIDMQGSDYDGPMYNGGVMQIQIGEIYDSTTGVRTNKAYSRIYYSGTTWSSWKPIQGGSGLFYGSSATAAGTGTKDVVCPEFTAVDLVPGTTISVKFTNTNSAAVGNLALNVNGTGAHNVRYVYNGSYSTIPGAGYIKADQLYLFTYDGTYWVVQMMYNTNSVPGLYYYTKKTYTVLNPYMLCLTKDSEYVLPVNTQNTTATTKTMTTELFDPFGEIYYYAGSSAVSAGGYPNGSLYNSFTYSSVLDLRYSFNTGTTLTARKDVYLVCQPQFSSGKPTGKVTLYTPYVTQTIPVTDQSNPVMGLIYIKIGNAYDTYRIQLDPQKPIYYYVNGEIREWTNTPSVPSGGSSGQVLRKQSADDYDYDWGTLDIHNVPSGGSANQVLTKNSSTNYDVSWKTPAGGLPTGGSLGQVLAKKTATNYDVEWIDPPSGVKIYNISYNSVTHTYALPDTFTNVRNLFIAGTLVILSNNGLMYYLSEASANVLAFTTAVSDDYFVYRIEWRSSDTAIDQDTELTLYNNYVPSGGTTGQFLVKKSNTNYDLQWVTVPNANGVSF